MYDLEINLGKNQTQVFVSWDEFNEYWLTNDVDMNDVIQRHIHGPRIPLERRRKLFLIRLKNEYIDKLDKV